MRRDRPGGGLGARRARPGSRSPQTPWLSPRRPGRPARPCSIYVEGLGNDVLGRADAFFTELETHREVGSIELTKLLGLKTPRDIPGNLTTSLKCRAQKLGLERPWIEQSGSARTIWREKNSIARRMR